MFKPTWCPGCGNFGIWQALQDAFSELKIEPHQAVLVYGIGCHGNMANWLPITAFEGLHGRTLPVASGIKMISPGLTVLAIAGDGDCYGEGTNHFLHAARRNLDLTLLVHNNQVYALTTGQTSPSSNKGFKTKSTPTGTLELALNPLSISIAAGASFVARGFGGDIPHLTDLIIKAIKHKGFSIVDILQPCITFNQVNTFDWFGERIYKLEEENFKPTSKLVALEKSLEWPQNGIDGKIPIGIFYEEEREISEKLVISNWKLGKKENMLKNLLKEFL
ncbi:2-oxoacid ferredoxin oxidoreductase [Candidatus Gottesmanbacteria bacterium]|nr:2-oxoacid ferredoxin oxidoreductase [Candidatus Gottesmanbacteria bacterium]